MSKSQTVERWKNLHNIYIKDDHETGERIADGLVTVGSVDSDGEIVMQDSAFDKLQQWLALGGTPITYMHDVGGSCGHCIEVEAMTRMGDTFAPASSDDEIDAVRVVSLIGKDYSFGTMFHGEVNVNNIWAMLVQKAINKLSIGFRGFEAGEDDATGAMRVGVQRVFEYAFVTVPAQREAVFAVQRMIKSLGIADDCTDCRTRHAADFKRLDNMGRDQWRYVVEHAREHGADHPNDLGEIARAFVDAGKALRGGL